MTRSLPLAAFLLLSSLPSGAALSVSSPSGEEVWRLDCGAEASDFTDPRGNWWTRDEPFASLSRWGHVAGTPADSGRPVDGTDIPEVFRTHRWGGTDMAYRFEVPNGQYDVTLHFVETYFTGPGLRVFDVALEGSVVLDDLDVWTLAAGSDTALSYSFSAVVSDERLDVTFPEIRADQAMISGIEVKARSVSDDDFLSFIQKKMWWYFWNETDPGVGLVRDTADAFAPGGRRKASIATTGFALSILTIAVERGWISRAEALARTRATLDTFKKPFDQGGLFNHHGFWYHFLDYQTRERWDDPVDGRSEVSTVDSALFILGAIQAGEYFRATDRDVADTAAELFERMEWDRYTQHGGDSRFVSMGWNPETGYLSGTWSTYCESVFVDLLAFASPGHAVSTAAWTYMDRNWKPDYGGLGDDVWHLSQLFAHQYHHLYYDLFDKHDAFGDYARNTRSATTINRLTCLNDPRYDTHRWGLTACWAPDNAYRAYGVEMHDGTVAPTAAGASIEFTPSESKAALRHMFFQYKHWIWGRDGFVDSFQTAQTLGDGVTDLTLGLDNGPMVIAIENLRTGLVRDSFMRSPYAQAGLDKAGLTAYAAPYAYASSVTNDNFPAKALDGSLATRWESRWYSDPQFFAMDFLIPKQVNTARLRWEAAHAQDYGIQYSEDGATWTEAATVTGGNGGEDVVRFPPVTARHFRVLGRTRGGVGGNLWGYSLWECRFEDEAPPPPPLASAKAYPNPARPGRGGVITFSDLPAGAQVTLLTIAGDRVRRLEPADAAGRTTWDAANGGGEPVAGGVYFALAEKDGESHLLRVVIER